MPNVSEYLDDSKYRRTSLYAIDRDRKIWLAYNEFAYKKTKDDCKLEDRFYKKASFSIANSQIKRPHITRPPVHDVTDGNATTSPRRRFN